jgi:uncharacterized iron-regulated membrane protein
MSHQLPRILIFYQDRSEPRRKRIHLTLWLMQNFLRKWHRWIGLPAALFLLFASVTGIILAGTEFFGAAEALREHNRTLVSPVTLQSPAAQWSDPLAKAFATAAAQTGGAPVDSVTIAFKGNQPTVTIYTGKPAGGEDRKLVFDAKTGALLRSEAYTDKSFLLRLHSGEAFGDGGLVLAMFWGLALVLLTVSGIIIYLKMRRPGAKGLKKVFWLFALGGFVAGLGL